MQPSDVAALRETWEAECHADAPKGACCCCYRSHHHQHQVRTEAAEAEVARLRAVLQQVYDFGHLTTLEYTAKYPGDTRHRSEIMRGGLGECLTY